MVMDLVTETPIMTRSDAAHLLGLPPSRLSQWTSGATPLVHTTRIPGFRVTFPLVGLAEASILDALRQQFSMQRIRGFTDNMRERFNDPRPLVNPQLLTDGADAYMSLLEEDGLLVRTSDAQTVLRPVIEAHLRPLGLDPSGNLRCYRLHQFENPVTVDPRYNGGNPSFTSNRIPLRGPAGYIAGGDDPGSIQKDFGLSDSELHDVQTHQDWILALD